MTLLDAIPPSALSTAALLEAAALLLAFVVALFVGSMVVPGRRLTPTGPAGAQRTKLNGLALFAIVVAAAAIGQVAGWFSLATLHTRFAALFVAANVFAFGLAGWLYWRAARERDAPAGFWRGFFLGRELSPAWFGVDLKLFSYRPSLMGLALLNASFAVAQYETHGELTLAMTVYQVFAFLYVLNYFQFEYGMVHTWDIVSERFGWMLIWGDYVLVPFFYCIAGWWLVDAAGPPLSPWAAAAIVALFVFGFVLFRGANGQKHRFRQDPDTRIWGRTAESLDGRLLVSGFWGVGRHLNYTGEICVYVAFALTTGFASFVPYLLPAWLTVLLVHRARRDERRCRAKYGALWERYTERARFSMLPYVY